MPAKKFQEDVRTETSQESRRKASMFHTEGSHMNFIKHGKIRLQRKNIGKYAWAENHLRSFLGKSQMSSLLVSYSESYIVERTGTVLSMFSVQN